MLTERQYLYRGLNFLCLLVCALIILIMEMSNKHTPILKLLDALFYLGVLLFGTLWLRNLASIFGLFLYSIDFNLQLFKNPLMGWNKGIEIESRFWVLGFIC